MPEKTVIVEMGELVKVAVKKAKDGVKEVQMGWMGKKFILPVGGKEVVMPLDCVEHFKEMFGRDEKASPGSTINPEFVVTKI